MEAAPAESNRRWPGEGRLPRGGRRGRARTTAPARALAEKVHAHVGAAVRPAPERKPGAVHDRHVEYDHELGGHDQGQGKPPFPVLEGSHPALLSLKPNTRGFPTPTPWDVIEAGQDQKYACTRTRSIARWCLSIPWY